MKKSKYTAFLVAVVLFINCFSIVSMAEEQPMSASDFSALVQQFASDYTPGGIASGNISDKPLNRLIVKTSSNDPLDNYYGAIAKLEGYDGIHILQFDTKTQTQSALANLQNDNIEYVEYDVWLGIEGSADGWCSCSDNPSINVTCECCSGEQGMCNCKDVRAKNGHFSWNSSAVQVDEAFDLIENLQINCKDIKVAVFDTGLYIEHTDFDLNRIDLDEKYKLLINGVEYETNKDGHYHGTHVAGTIYDNTMENVKICPYRVYGDEDFDFIPYLVFWSALNAAIDKEVDVINISSIQRKFTSEDEEKHNTGETFSELLDKADNKNIVIVAAAGNSKIEIKDNQFPAAYSKALTVSATTIDNVPDKSYSNYGKYVDIGAPGTDIYSTTPLVPLKADYNNNEINVSHIRDSGTSYAAPLVTAAVAMIKSIDPDITPSEVKRLIKETAYVPDNWEESCGENNYGTGIVNFYNIAKVMLEHEYSAMPTISINSDNKFEITAPEGVDAKIFYTLDGTIPSLENHLTYTAPLNLRAKNATSVKAACYENGKLISEPAVYNLITNNEKTIFYKWSGTLTTDADTSNAKWHSYNPDIASVDSEGNIRGISKGDTLITCSLPTGERIIWKVNVKYSPLQAFFVLFFFGFLWI